MYLMNILTYLNNIKEKAYQSIPKDLRNHIIKEFIKEETNYNTQTLLIDIKEDLEKIVDKYKLFFNNHLRDKLIKGDDKYWYVIFLNYAKSFLKNVRKHINQDTIKKKINARISYYKGVLDDITNDKRISEIEIWIKNLSHASNTEINYDWLEKYRDETINKFNMKLWLGNDKVNAQEKNGIITMFRFRKNKISILQKYNPHKACLLTFLNVILRGYCKNTIRIILGDIEKGEYIKYYKKTYGNNDSNIDKDPLKNKPDKSQNFTESFDTKQYKLNIIEKIKHNHRFKKSSHNYFIFAESIDKYKKDGSFMLQSDEINLLNDRWHLNPDNEKLSDNKLYYAYKNTVYPYIMRKLLLIKIHENINKIHLDNDTEKKIFDIWIANHFYEIISVKKRDISFEDRFGEDYKTFREKLIKEKKALVENQMNIFTKNAEKKIKNAIFGNKKKKDNPINNLMQFFNIKQSIDVNIKFYGETK